MPLKTFTPNFDIFPESQKKLWTELKDVPKSFILYGGTAIALQLGHRESIDFDLFSPEGFDPDDLLITERGQVSCFIILSDLSLSICQDQKE